MENNYKLYTRTSVLSDLENVVFVLIYKIFPEIKERV